VAEPPAAGRSTASLLPRRTERLVLRPFRYGDEADVLAYRGRADVCRYIPADPLPDDAATEFITERIAATAIVADQDRITLAVELDGQVIGDVLVRTGRLEDRQAELGWVISPDFQNLGYATEAARELIKLAFTDLAMHRVWAQLDPRNAASVRVCQRLGLRLEGHLREDMWLKGEWSDAAIYAILRSEWAG
jgi:RimJ/RimL family protein N-acetyltransferase